jgi:folate-binding protein YgfZ
MGAQNTEEETVERDRITRGIPSVPVDIGPNDLPNEGGLEEVAISYTKGCYLGQEVMARLKNLGQVRRRLHLVRGPGEVPGSGSPLFQKDRKVGDVRTAAGAGSGFVAMAMLTNINLGESGDLSLLPDGPANISIVRRI